MHFYYTLSPDGWLLGTEYHLRLAYECVPQLLLHLQNGGVRLGGLHLHTASRQSWHDNRIKAHDSGQLTAVYTIVVRVALASSSWRVLGNLVCPSTGRRRGAACL